MKIIAYYLPQFHEIPENDKWWGKGFTEWDNVKKGKPLFDGHYQPRVPLGDNYYDLSNLETLQWQAQIAKDHGVYGFCFYHYWFNGKLLLEKPAEALLSNPGIDIHFCFSWANENWTNGWVSSSNDILISHNNSDERDWRIHFQYLLKFFKDDRYIKIDGKPLIILYYPPLLQKRNKMIKMWRKMALASGFPGLVVVFQYCSFFYERNGRDKHFDYGMEFLPSFFEWGQRNRLYSVKSNTWIKITTFLQKNFRIHITKKNNNPSLKLQDFDKAWDWYLNKYYPRTPTIANAFVGWDNTPRKGRKGAVYLGSTPEKFRTYLEQLILKNSKYYSLDCLFIFAWNEWGEGGYLEPDQKFKFGYLDAIKEALLDTRSFPLWSPAGTIERNENYSKKNK